MSACTKPSTLLEMVTESTTVRPVRLEALATDARVDPAEVVLAAVVLVVVKVAVVADC